MTNNASEMLHQINLINEGFDAIKSFDAAKSLKKV